MRARAPEDSEEDEGADVVCNMVGQSWGSLFFPITIDPGVCASVMFTSWCDHAPVQETFQSKAGDYYRAANCNKIYHEGEGAVPMMIQEWSMSDMRSTACEVSRSLGSVSQMCRTRHRVVFNPLWSEE